MDLIDARQAWTDSQQERNASVTATAMASAATATKISRDRARRHEVVFAALGDEYEEERIEIVRQKVSISETRRTPLGRSTDRAAHLATIGKVQRAIETLPFQVQQFGHYLYHPSMNMRHVMNAVMLITAKAKLPDLTSAKRVKAQYMVTMALQSYKGEAVGAIEWGPARVAAEIKIFYGLIIDPDHWKRDWQEIWDFLKKTIAAVDREAQAPLWEVIFSENNDSVA